MWDVIVSKTTNNFSQKLYYKNDANKRKGQKDKQRSIKHTYKTKDTYQTGNQKP